MERIKAKILKNFDQLMEEHDVLILTLKNILEKNRELVSDSANISDGEMSMNKKRFLNILEFQHSVIQKFLEVGVELDEFSKKSHVPYLTYLNDCPVKNEISPLSSSPCLTETNTTTIFYGREEQPACDAPVSLELIEESHLSIQNMKVDNIEVLTNEDCKQTSTAETFEKPNIVTNGECEKVIPLVTIIEKNTIESPSEDKSICNKDCRNLSDDTSSSESVSRSNKDDGKKASADVSSSEEISQKEKLKTKSIHEKLKSKKLMTRRDRFLQNLQRPDIPDLSFKPSNKAFDSTESYATCPESSSSTSAKKVIERNRKKRRSIDRDVHINGICYKQPPEPYVNLVCLVSCIISPSEFYINRCDENIEVIETIGFQLAEIFKDTVCRYADKKTAMEKLGNHCVCYLEEYECWYRVTVKNWRLKARDYQEDLVTVYLVDYGHTRNTSYKTLRELSEEFCHVPPCAIKCHLAWLYPQGSTKDNLLEIWSQSALDFFKNNLTSPEGTTLFKVLYVEKVGYQKNNDYSTSDSSLNVSSDSHDRISFFFHQNLMNLKIPYLKRDSWGVDIIKDSEKDDCNTFGQQLIDNEMAVEIFQDAHMIVKDQFFLNQLKTAQGMAGISQSMNMEERLEKYHENTTINEFDNIDQALLRYKAKDEARICKNTRPDGTCFKGKRCKLEHGRLRSDGITTDKQYIYVSAFKQLDMPSAGTTVKLRITNVVSVNIFYAWLMTHSEDLKNLTSKMNQRDVVIKYKHLEVSPSRGEMVIAKNWNNYWYRAQVKDVYHFPHNPEETFQVFYVDLGEIADVKMSDLRTITPEFLYLPCQAIYCKLYNVKPKDDLDPDVGKAYCENSFLCQIFNAYVEYASYSTLEVRLRKERNNEDIGEQIIEEGYGELRDVHIFPSESILVD